MKRRRPTIAQRIPVFLGCEGESEQAYGQLLNELLRELDLPVHLEVVPLTSGAGDPIARLKRAGQEVKHREKRRSEFKHKFILIDSDQVANNAQRRHEAEGLAHDLGIGIIWQELCHETLLLHHIQGFTTHQPPTAALALSALRGQWPEYQKPMTRVALSKRLSLADVRRAAGVEPALSAFLQDIKLLP
jgi:hypothetical protein